MSWLYHAVVVDVEIVKEVKADHLRLTLGLDADIAHRTTDVVNGQVGHCTGVTCSNANVATTQNGEAIELTCVDSDICTGIDTGCRDDDVAIDLHRAQSGWVEGPSLIFNRRIAVHISPRP